MTTTPTGASRVRIATAADGDDLIELCKLLHSENGVFAMDQTRVRATLDRAFRREGGLIGVIGNPGHVEGAIVLQISQLWYSEQWCLEELFSFVSPRFRRSTNAKDLIAFAKQASEKLGIPLLIGVLSNERTEAKVKLYSRHLGNPAGAFFLYGATTGGVH